MGVTVGLGGTDPRDRRRQRSTTTTTATTTTHSNHIWQPIHLLTGFVGLYIVGTMIFLITFQNSSNNNNDSGININNNYGNYQASNDRSSLISPPSLVKKKESQHSPTQSEPQRPQIVHAIFDESKWAKKRNEHVNCTYKSLSDLQPHEAYPSTEYDGPHRRHSVNPPSGGNLSLVCCETTVGNLNIVTHHNWAPHGAKRFMDMVNTGYFNSQGGVPMMRCLKGFICQFGLHSDPSISRQFSPTIPDDPNWLPQGPTHRENEHGVKVCALISNEYVYVGLIVYFCHAAVSVRMTHRKHKRIPFSLPPFRIPKNKNQKNKYKAICKRIFSLCWWGES